MPLQEMSVAHFIEGRSRQQSFIGISLGLWLVVIGYVLGVRLIYLDQKAWRLEPAALAPDAQEGKRGLLNPGLGFLGTAVVAVVAGPFMACAVGKIAEGTGLGKSFIGSTVVAYSTSLPELVASLAAIRRGAHDLAIGNILRSDTFNMLRLVPLDLVHNEPHLE